MKNLKGDSVEMGIQSEFLALRGYDLDVNEGTPSVKDSSYPQSLKLMYLYDIEGWWNYKDELIAYGICTEEQFNERFKLYREK